MKTQKRGTERKEKITVTLKTNTINKLDGFLEKSNVTRSYGLDYIINLFIDKNQTHIID